MTSSPNTIDPKAEQARAISVTLYPNCAEVTRTIRVDVEKGTTQLNLSGLPTNLDKDSIRVRGQGHSDITIGRVTVSTGSAAPIAPNTDPNIRALRRKKTSAETALQRTQESIAALQSYLSTLTAEHTSPDDISKVMDAYETTSKRLDDRAAALEDEIASLDQKLNEERPTPPKTSLSTHVSVELFATSHGQVDVFVSYFVNDCKWEPSYDIHATLEDDAAQVDLVYKATVSQNTAEDWKDVSLTLETLSPSLETQTLDLEPWRISLVQRVPHFHCRPHAIVYRSSVPQPPSAPLARSRTAAAVPPPPPIESSTPSEEAEEMQTMTSLVNVSDSVTIPHATFKIPTEVTILGDGSSSSFVVTTLKLSGKVAWVTMPKVDPRAHIKGKFSNTSDVPLLKGNANIYLNGTFMKRTELDAISPRETFSLALGHDPSIRVVYPRRSQLSSRSGYTFRESFNETFEQRILITNSKKFPLDLKVIDQIPVSDNAALEVKLLTPALATITPSSVFKKTTQSSTPTQPHDAQGDKVTGTASFIKKGITADWDREGRSGKKGGMIAWQCHLESQESTELLLKWSVETTDITKFTISGL